jgi:hypothetical protein
MIVLSVILSFGAASGALAMSTPVQNLAQSCTYSGVACSKASDITSGACRAIQYNTPYGMIKDQVCDKGSWYEIYRQEAPSGLGFRACIGGGCVDQYSGFAKFTSTTPISSATGTESTGTVTTSVSNAPSAGSSGSYLLSPASTGFGGQTRAANYQTLASALTDNPNVVQKVSCSQGTCLWVPWYKSSSSCQVSDLMGGANCDIGQTPDGQNNCMVTDEFSQAGMVLAMGNDQAKFDQWVNTVRALKSSKYGSLPVWKASRTASGINNQLTSNQDDASDATARIIIALYTASNSDYFDSGAKANYKAFADTLAADFVKYDFNHACRPGRNGLQICNWLASGAAAGSSGLVGTNDYSYAGYYGDVMLALMAAYRSTGNSQYMNVARDTAETYLLASNYNGASLSVPPKSFKWDTSSGTPKAVCTNYCTSSQWDDSDAVRAVSVSKAMYYGRLNGLNLDTDLGKYCEQWTSSAGVEQNAYTIQYHFDGTPSSSPQKGYYQNGLGSFLNFYAKQGDLQYKLDEALSHYDAGTRTFDKASCMGVYRATFPIVSLGSAIGRDSKAFGASGTTITAAAQPTTQVVQTATAGQTTADQATKGTKQKRTATAASSTDEPAHTPTPTPIAVKMGTMTRTKAPTATSLSVASLSIVSRAYTNGPISTLTRDVTTGSCRTVAYTNPGTYTQVFLCAKGSGYEMYLQTPLANGRTVTCVGASCVGPSTAYARW